MQIFARLTKVDEAARTVEGIIASEAVDRSGEIFDYDRSKPNFERWSEGIAKATEGKNLGNVRVMHGKAVAGVTKTLNFDDVAKQISVVAEIVDDNEWNKVKKGCYSGFSIGGSYAAKWEDPVLGKTRYEADPIEYSLVDLPCNPDATFTVIKADGTEELCKFETVGSDVEWLHKVFDGLSEEDRDGLMAKIAPKPTPTTPIAKDFTAQAERLAKHGDAATTGNVLRVLLDMPTIEKGLWTVSNFADVLQSLANIADCAEDEAAWEGDGSKVPAQLRAALKPVADAFLAMAAEEVAEAIKPATEEVVVVELAAKDELAKAADELAKATDALQKMTAERDELAGTVEKVTKERDDTLAKMAELTKQYADWLSQPAPVRGVARAVEKTVGLSDPPKAPDTDPVKKADGSIDHLATAEKLMKHAYTQPSLMR